MAENPKTSQNEELELNRKSVQIAKKDHLYNKLHFWCNLIVGGALVIIGWLGLNTYENKVTTEETTNTRELITNQ